MTQLLALETSGASCSVAIYANGIWTEDTQNVQRLHNQVLLRQIDALARRAGVAPNEFQVIAFGAGPGSFTGVRIAAATAQAIAFATDAQVLPVSSSRVLAEAARVMHSAAGLPGVVTVIRSRRDAHYLAAWSWAPDGCRQVLDDVLHLGLVAPPLGVAHGWPAVGDRPPWWSAADDEPPFLECAGATALLVGHLALADFAAGGGLAPELGLPRYVNGDSPWKPRDATTSSNTPGPDAAPAAR